MRVRKSVERWFVVKDDPDNARIKIKHLTPGETREIRDEVFTHEIEYVNKKPIVRQTSNLRADRELLLTKQVVDWENFFNIDGEPLACTPENVILCSNTIDGFDELVSEFAEILAKDIKKEVKEQEKN